MSDSSESISLQVTVHLRPEDVPKFWAAFEPAYKAVTAEPECTFFENYLLGRELVCPVPFLVAGCLSMI